MKQESIKVNFNRDEISINVKALAFKEGEYHILYVDSLQLSSYGHTLDEAHEMMKVSLDAFTEDLFSLGEYKALDYLKKMGWSQHNYFKKRLVNLSNTTFDDIKKEFDLPEDTPVKEIEIVV